MTIKVGDIVIWRHGKSKRGDELRMNMPLGVTGCEVLELGETADDGRPLAKLKLPSLFGERTVYGLVADLEEIKPKAPPFILVKYEPDAET